MGVRFIQGFIMEDTMTFNVYKSKLSKFKTFVSKSGLKVRSVQNDGGYRKVTVLNSGSFDAWSPVVQFYKSEVKV